MMCGGNSVAPDNGITAETTIMRVEPVISAEVGDEIVMLHVEKNAYYDTNAIGAAVWRALAAPTTARAICEQLVLRYAVDLPTCEKDVLEFIRQAHSEGLIQTTNQG